MENLYVRCNFFIDDPEAADPESFSVPLFVPPCKPQRAVRAGRYPPGSAFPRIAIRRLQGELADRTCGRDPADFVPVALGEPQRAVGAGRYSYGEAIRRR